MNASSSLPIQIQLVSKYFEHSVVILIFVGKQNIFQRYTVNSLISIILCVKYTAGNMESELFSMCHLHWISYIFQILWIKMFQKIKSRHPHSHSNKCSNKKICSTNLFVPYRLFCQYLKSPALPCMYRESFLELNNGISSELIPTATIEIAFINFGYRFQIVISRFLSCNRLPNHPHYLIEFVKRVVSREKGDKFKNLTGVNTDIVR